MKDKSKILVSCIVVLLVGAGLVLAFLFLSTKPKTNNPNGSNNPTSYPNGQGGNQNGGNTVEIGKVDATKYKYVAITPEDTVKLFTDKGEELIINLSKRKWQKVLWSDSAKTLAVLGNFGDDKNVNLDLSFYSFAKDSWNRFTNFLGFSTGVTSYIWKGDSHIFFTQGVTPDNWLHDYDLAKVSEIRKVDRIDGTIIGTNSDETYLLYKMNKTNQIRIYDYQGDEVQELTGIQDENKVVIKVENAIFTGDPTKVILISHDKKGKQKLYKMIVNDTVAVDISLGYEFNPICAANTDVLTGYVIETGNVLTLVNYNVKDQKEHLIIQKDFPDDSIINKASFKCFNQTNILFDAVEKNVGKIDEVNWYNINSSSQFEQIAFLKNMKEVDVR